MSRHLTAIVERDGDGYVALCPQVDVASQGSTRSSSKWPGSVKLIGRHRLHSARLSELLARPRWVWLLPWTTRRSIPDRFGP